MTDTPRCGTCGAPVLVRGAYRTGRPDVRARTYCQSHGLRDGDDADPTEWQD